MPTLWLDYALLENSVMGELGERRWAVMSERGCEASGLAYEEAARLVQQLRSDKIYGLCIITGEAALRLTNTEAPAGEASVQTDPAATTTRQ